jgi:hypothetical protein
MPDEKDRLGDQLRDKERADENRYFSERSKQQIERLRQTRAAATVTVGHCPRCGTKLEVLQRHGAAADACPKECGVWLDRGEVERITKREGEGWLARLLLGVKG